MANHKNSKEIPEENSNFRIDILSRAYPPIREGSSMFVYDLVNSLDNYKFNIYTGRLKKSQADDGINGHIDLIRAGPARPDKKTNKLLYPLYYIEELLFIVRTGKLLKNSDSSILHINDMPFLYTASFDYLFNSHIFSSISLKLLRLKKVKKPVITTLHGLHMKTGSKYDGMSEKRVLHYLKHILEVSDYITCVDLKIKEFLEENSQKLVPGNNVPIKFIPNFVDTDVFSYSDMIFLDDIEMDTNKNDKIKIAKNKLNIGFIGRIEASRGVSYLSALITNLPDFAGLTVITPSSEDIAERFFSEFSDEVRKKINLKINLTPAELSKEIKKMHILFNPVIAEGISRASIEANACGRPAIMLDSGNRYPLLHEKTGFLYSGNIDELLSILKKVNDDREFLSKIGKAACELVTKEFSKEDIAPEFEEIYRKVVEI